MRQYMVVAEVDDIDRKAPVVAELIASVAESCARMLVLEHYPWTAAELAPYLARLLTRGIPPGLSVQAVYRQRCDGPPTSPEWTRDRLGRMPLIQPCTLLTRTGALDGDRALHHHPQRHPR